MLTWLHPHLSRPSTTSSITTSEKRPIEVDFLIEDTDPLPSGSQSPDPPPSRPPSASSRPQSSAASESGSASTSQQLKSAKPSAKKKKRPSCDAFESELMRGLSALNENKDTTREDGCDLFGEEVARGCRAITDPYRRELLIRKTRDIIFQERFPDK